MRVREQAGRDRAEEDVRAAQWMKMVGTQDPWPLFCQAVKRHRELGTMLHRSSTAAALDDEHISYDSEECFGDMSDLQPGFRVWANGE